MTTVTSEKDMLEVVVARLRERAIPFAVEVPFMSRSIDLVYLLNDQFVSIEFKRHDWRRASQQAMDHLLGVDKSYICLFPRRSSDGIIEAVCHNGIGVCYLDESEILGMRVVLEARESRGKWSVSREWLVQAFDKYMEPVLA